MGQVSDFGWHHCGLKSSRDQTFFLAQLSDNVLSTLVFPVVRDNTFLFTEYLSMIVGDKSDHWKAIHPEREKLWRWPDSLCVLLPWCCLLHWLKAVSFTSILFVWLFLYCMIGRKCSGSCCLICICVIGPSCCTHYHEESVPVRMLKYYKIQDDTGYCKIKAVM